MDFDKATYIVNFGPDHECLMRPEIVLITGSLLGGGAERVLSDMANYWARNGLTVMLVTWSGPSTTDFYELDPAVTRQWLDTSSKSYPLVGKVIRNFQRIFKLRQFLSRQRPGAVLSFIYTSNVLTILASVGLKTTVVVSERTDPTMAPKVSVGWGMLRRLCYAWADRIVTQSDSAANWVRRHCRKQPSVIHNPLRSLPSIVAERELLIIAVGRLECMKGFDLLLRAFAEISADFEDWNLVFIGDGSERENLGRLRDELGLAERVEFTGFVQNVESWMARAGLVVQPSRFEGFPNVLLESMGMGAPVISSDCLSGPREIIQDCINGRLVPVDDVDALAGAMSDLMSDPCARRKLGTEAMKVRERFRQDRIMSQWEYCIFGKSVTGDYDPRRLTE